MSERRAIARIMSADHLRNQHKCIAFLTPEGLLTYQITGRTGMNLSVEYMFGSKAVLPDFIGEVGGTAFGLCQHLTKLAEAAGENVYDVYYPDAIDETPKALSDASEPGHPDNPRTM